ncbi:MAG: hypothetical protein WC001_00950 [Desulfurivibrionaceae bacterium]
MGQQVFEARHFFVFSADTHDGAGSPLGGLFTLIAKHVDSPWLWVKVAEIVTSRDFNGDFSLKLDEFVPLIRACFLFCEFQQA